ncbi:MAG: hypothetical protein HY820_27535 [Acidobacteria bacterium]|nr:hypothetical protein [Acidobacteriota bacterium]
MSTKSTALLALLALLALAPAYAERPLQFNAPFDFKVGPTHMSAGTYSVTYPASGTILVRNEDTRKAAIVITIAADNKANAENGSLVFARYGEVYFLHKVNPPGAGVARQLIKSRAEQQVERETARHGKADNLVAVKLSR